MREILIIHYNTPELTEATIRSVRKHCGDGWHVTLFDNSDRMPFWKPMDGVTVIDNTKGQYIDFEAFLSCYPERGATESSNWGSAKHCKSVDYCSDLLPDGFVLMDSDVVLTRSIDDWWDDRVAWRGWVHCNTKQWGIRINRLCPFLCWLNVPMLRSHGIRYFNPRKMWRLTSREPDCYYDTGAWLLEASAAKSLPCIREKELTGKYIEHFRGGSWRKGERASHLWLADMSKHFI